MPLSPERKSQLGYSFRKFQRKVIEFFETPRFPPVEEITNANKLLSELGYDYQNVEIAPAAMHAILKAASLKYPLPNLQLSQEPYDFSAPKKSLPMVPPEHIGPPNKIHYDIWFTHLWLKEESVWQLHWQRYLEKESRDHYV